MFKLLRMKFKMQHSIETLNEKKCNVQTFNKNISIINSPKFAKFASLKLLFLFFRLKLSKFFVIFVSQKMSENIPCLK